MSDQKKGVLITDATAIQILIENIKKRDNIRVSTEISYKGRKRQIYVGSIIHGDELSNRNPLLCTRDELVFYREVKRWTDVYSYKEETISMNIGLFHFLKQFAVRLVFTYAEDDSRLNISPVETYRFESNLGIGYLRRARLEETISLLNSKSLDLTQYNFTRTVVAETRYKTKATDDARKMLEVKEGSVDLNQRGLFD